MEKLEIKMARFVELSKKFTTDRDDIMEIVEIENLMEPNISETITTNTDMGVSTLWNTITTNPTGDGQPAKKEKSERERVEEGIARRWKVYEEYKEYLELQKVLSEYFEAESKL